MTRIRKAAIAAVAVLTAVALFDESNGVAIVARKAIEIITRFLGLTA